MSYIIDWKISLESITKEELLERINNGGNYVLVDTIGKYNGNKYKIKSATTIDYPIVVDRRKEISPYDEIIVYCHSKGCVASKKVAAALISLNVKNVKIYEGGITEWTQNNLPVEDE